MKQARQGDVFISKVEKLPKETKELERQGGRIILAAGEATGHHHAISADMVRFVINEQTQRRFLKVEKKVALNHEEHAEIQLPAGKYEVEIQREYDGEYIRTVVD